MLQQHFQIREVPWRRRCCALAEVHVTVLLGSLTADSGLRKKILFDNQMRKRAKVSPQRLLRLKVLVGAGSLRIPWRFFWKNLAFAT